MKTLLNWALKNSWNLFGAIGVAGTFYFSLIHVPNYVNEITTGKINVIHESLMDDIQEIAFHDKPLSLNHIETLIHGKELSQGVSYPYTTDELLIQVQERFMGNKFISLEKREKIFNTIAAVRAEYKPIKANEESDYDWSKVISWLFSGLGIFIALIGAISLTKKLKTDQETEVDIMSGDIAINELGPSLLFAALEFEQMIGSILSDIGVLKSDNTKTPNIGYDFIAEHKDKEFIVEAKKYRKMLGFGTARDFLHKVSTSGKGGILIVSSGATQRAKDLFLEHNILTSNQKALLVIGNSNESIKKQLENFFGI